MDGSSTLPGLRFAGLTSGPHYVGKSVKGIAWSTRELAASVAVFSDGIVPALSFASPIRRFPAEPSIARNHTTSGAAELKGPGFPCFDASNYITGQVIVVDGRNTVEPVSIGKLFKNRIGTENPK